MASKDEILNAVKIVNEYAGKPTVGVIADLLKALEDSTTSTPAKEVRVVEAKEQR